MRIPAIKSKKATETFTPSIFPAHFVSLFRLLVSQVRMQCDNAWFKGVCPIYKCLSVIWLWEKKILNINILYSSCHFIISSFLILFLVFLLFYRFFFFLKLWYYFMQMATSERIHKQSVVIKQICKLFPMRQVMTI